MDEVHKYSTEGEKATCRRMTLKSTPNIKFKSIPNNSIYYFKTYLCSKNIEKLMRYEAESKRVTLDGVEGNRTREGYGFSWICNALFL